MKKTYFLNANILSSFARYSPSLKTGLLSSILQIFKFKILIQVFRICRISSPFEGGRGDVKSGFSRIVGIITKNIPLAPFKRGNDSVQTRILEKKINILPLIKQDLTAQFWKGGVIMILLLLTISLNAQNQLTQSFRFENGVYQTFEAFQQNSPTHTGNMIDGNFFINEKTKQAKVEYIRLKGTGKKINLDEIWGVVIRGIPYVKTSPNLPAHNLKVFASMEVRGNICYYAYDDIEEKEVTFRAYNPLIGKPFRTGKAMRKLPVIKEKMLRFATGEVTDFNYQNLLEWVAEEPEIIQALKSLGPVRSEDKLFDALLLYNDKHSVTLPINQ